MANDGSEGPDVRVQKTVVGSDKKSTFRKRLKRLSISIVSPDAAAPDFGVLDRLPADQYMNMSLPVCSTSSSSRSPLSTRAKILVPKGSRSRPRGSSISCLTPLISLQSISSTLSTEEDRPPTSNNLDTKQRMHLLRSARKLSKILGETPLLSDDESSSSGLRRSQRLTRDEATADCVEPRSPKLSLINRRPHLHFRLAQLTDSAQSSSPRSSPILTVDCTSPDRNTLRRSSLCLSTNPEPVSTASPSSPLGSEASALPSPVENAPLARRTKMTKLFRHLGENVPAELVYPCTPASSPTWSEPPRDRRAGSGQHYPCHTPNSQMMRQRRQSESCMGRRRCEANDMGLRRVQTVHSRRSGWDTWSNSPVAADQCQSMNKRQKAMNVKRASKMAQLFGQSPPHALFQITNIPFRDTSDDDDDGKSGACSLNDPCVLDRDSIYDPKAAGYSLTTYDSSDTRDTSLEIPPHLPLTPPHTMVNLNPESPQCQLRYIQEYTRCTSSPASAPMKGKPQPFKFPSPPGTPPPFCNYTRLSIDKPGSSVDSHTSSSTSGSRHSQFFNAPFSNSSHPAAQVTERVLDQAFRTRRRRVAKLSKFFGVGYHDLVNSMEHGYQVASPSPRASAEERERRSEDCVKVTVTQRTDRRWDSALWGSREIDTLSRPEDIKDVIGKLRELKAAS